MTTKVCPKYVLLFFFIIVLIEWVESIFFEEEGLLKEYMHKEGHYALYGGIKLLFLLAIFLVGYKGLSYLRVAWVKQVWVIWYIIVFISSGLRVLFLIEFHYRAEVGLLSSLIYVYTLGLVPFPYLAIWLLWMVANRSNKSSASS